MKWDDLSIADLGKLYSVCIMSNDKTAISKEQKKANNAIIQETIRRITDIRNELYKQLQDN